MSPVAFRPALSHVSVAVADLDRSAAFYDAVLGPLGLVRSWSVARAVGYGRPGEADVFAIKLAAGPVPQDPPETHVALFAPDEAAVAAFHEAGLAAGGTDEGPPGPRPRYGPGYHAAFLRDPDGHRLEAKVRR